MRLYQARLADRGYECLVPTEAEMDSLVTPAIALVKANQVASAYAPLAEAASRLVARGARAVVLGCTEIPLGIAAGPSLPFPVCDTLDALARAAIGWARG
jgi:aspartate racemase